MGLPNFATSSPMPYCFPEVVLLAREPSRTGWFRRIRAIVPFILISVKMRTDKPGELHDLSQR